MGATSVEGPTAPPPTAGEGVAAAVAAAAAVATLLQLLVVARPVLQQSPQPRLHSILPEKARG